MAGRGSGQHRYRGLIARALLALGVFGVFAGRVTAAENSGFALDRFEPAERGSDWFSLDSLDLRGHSRFAVGTTFDWAYKPLVLYNADDSVRANLVEEQAVLHLGGSVVLWDALRLGASLPIALLQSGEDGAVANLGYQAPTSGHLGDLRLAADVRLVGRYGDCFALAAGFQLHLPTGQRSNFTSDESVRVSPRIAAAGACGALVYAARLGVQLRTLDDPFAGVARGSELTFGAAVGARFGHERWQVGAELYGATVISSSDATFSGNGTPLELLIGGHARVASAVRVGLGAGPGLSHGLGSPSARLVASVEWTPGRATIAHGLADGDRDGVADVDDGCVETPGLASRAEARGIGVRWGCPRPVASAARLDSDGDGVLDDVDSCAQVAGVASRDRLKNGCPPPPPDRDEDGIPDAQDHCVESPGVWTGDALTNGCPPPPPDRDHDGIVDEKDACVDVAGSPSTDSARNGCPKVRIEGDRILLLEKIEFDPDRPSLRFESEAILTALAKLLAAHPEITKLLVEVHTDGQGERDRNVQLSGDRAATIVDWLVAHGIDAQRLRFAGVGPDRPIDDNQTEAGRLKNRRVELRILATVGK